MLTSGMVPALFPDDEKDAIVSQVRIILLVKDACNAKLKGLCATLMPCGRAVLSEYAN